ncbi:MAG: NAD(+)/NADH kinase [Candidatus Altiarchaeota archaeon]
MKHASIGVIASPHLGDGSFAKEGLNLLEEEHALKFEPVSASLFDRPETPINEFKVDLAVVFGGDGTILYAVNELRQTNPLVLGVNTGRVGFLSEIEPQNFLAAVKKLINGDYRVDERIKLCVNNKIQALNEVVLFPLRQSALLEFKILIEGETQLIFDGDGLIVSTPTGSTGHALSAGGPTVSSNACVFLIVPVNPIRRQQAPVIVPDDSKIEIQLINQEKQATLIVDGRVESTIEPTQKIVVEKSNTKARFIRLSKDDE